MRTEQANGVLVVMRVFGCVGVIMLATVVQAEPPPQPGTCWWPQLEAVLAASSDNRWPSSFDRSIGFLETNTGIRSGLEMTFTGYMMDHQKLRHATERWATWFIRNYPYLYWDPAARRFRIDVQAKAVKATTLRPRGPEDGDCFRPVPELEEIFPSLRAAPPQ
jgi:hypothetical protein